MTAPQLVHDKINLASLVKKLERSLTDEYWNEHGRLDKWITAQCTLQKIKYARKLLKNVEMYDLDPPPKIIQRYHDFEVTLGRIESFVNEIEKRTAPVTTRPDPLLPHIPVPSSSTLIEELHPPTETSLPLSPTNVPPPLTVDDLLLPSDQSAIPLSSANLLLSPTETLIPPVAPTTKSTAAATAVSTSISTSTAFLHNSNALQQELSDQLAQMANQLKRNAIHFSESLARDQATVEEAKVKIESNFDTMTKERVRLRDHRGKSGSTTCLVLMSTLIVAVSFVLMFFIIRLT